MQTDCPSKNDSLKEGLAAWEAILRRKVSILPCWSKELHPAWTNSSCLQFPCSDLGLPNLFASCRLYLTPKLLLAASVSHLHRRRLRGDMEMSDASTFWLVHVFPWLCWPSKSGPRQRCPSGPYFLFLCSGDLLQMLFFVLSPRGAELDAPLAHSRLFVSKSPPDSNPVLSLP